METGPRGRRAASADPLGTQAVTARPREFPDPSGVAVMSHSVIRHDTTEVAATTFAGITAVRAVQPLCQVTGADLPVDVQFIDDYVHGAVDEHPQQLRAEHLEEI